ncbi:MAG: hypothetical protein U5N86_11060 [Planctomycetota bacterium]|nr:hypothetical protein [Planctomycetota bacterium]
MVDFFPNPIDIPNADHIREDLRGKYVRLCILYELGNNLPGVCSVLARICEASGAGSEAFQWRMRAINANKTLIKENNRPIDYRHALSLWRILSDALIYPLRRGGWKVTLVGGLLAGLTLQFVPTIFTPFLVLAFVVLLVILAHLSIVLETSMGGSMNFPSVSEGRADFFWDFIIPGLKIFLLLFLYYVVPFVLIHVFTYSPHRVYYDTFSGMEMMSDSTREWLLDGHVFLLFMLAPAIVATLHIRGFWSALFPFYPVKLAILTGWPYLVAAVLFAGVLLGINALSMSFKDSSSLFPDVSHRIVMAMFMVLKIYVGFTFFRMFGLLVRRRAYRIGLKTLKEE